MTTFLKGNYELPEEPEDNAPAEDAPKSLTEQFEESALSKLGGSICFVAKGKTLLWAGDPDEAAS